MTGHLPYYLLIYQLTSLCLSRWIPLPPPPLAYAPLSARSTCRSALFVGRSVGRDPFYRQEDHPARVNTTRGATDQKSVEPSSWYPSGCRGGERRLVPAGTESSRLSRCGRNSTVTVENNFSPRSTSAEKLLTSLYRTGPSFFSSAIFVPQITRATLHEWFTNPTTGFSVVCVLVHAAISSFTPIVYQCADYLLTTQATPFRKDWIFFIGPVGLGAVRRLKKSNKNRHMILKLLDSYVA